MGKSQTMAITRCNVHHSDILEFFDQTRPQTDNFRQTTAQARTTSPRIDLQYRDGQGIKLKYATFHLYLFVLNIY